MATAPKFTSSITKTMVWMLLIGYSLILVVRGMYQNYSINAEISRHKQVITALEKQKREKELALVYYKSTAFRELEARKRLNLKGEGEKVVALKKHNDVRLPIVERSDVDKLNSIKPPVPWQTWWELLFSTNKKTS